MALKLHPDRNGSNTEFGKITNAYNVLKSIPAKPVKKQSSSPQSATRSQRTTDHRIHLNRTGQNIQKSTNKMKVFGQSMSASFGRIMGNLQTKTKVMPRCKMRTRMKN